MSETSAPVNHDRHHARFFELSSELYCVVGPDGRFRAHNSRWSELLGYTGAELAQRPFFHMVHPEDLQATQDVMQALASGTGGVSHFVNRFVKRDGSILHIDWSAVFDRDDGNYLASGRDVSDQRAVERRFDNFFSVSLELLCLVGTDGYFKELNPHWSELLGWSDAELKDKPFIEFVHPDDREATLQEAANLAEGQQLKTNFENRYATKSGEWRWLRWTAALDPEQGVLIAAARDITDARASQHHLSAALEQVSEANEAKTHFLANMSHELRTPLNSIIGFSNVLLKNKQGNLRGNDLQFLTRVRDSGRHLLELINDVLDISKVESGNLELMAERVNLESLLTDVRRLHEGVNTESAVELRIDVPSRIDDLWIDSLRMRQIIVNLVSNAMKFTETGSVTLRVENWPGTRKPAKLAVIDTGIGISQANLDRVFRPFQQADGSTSRRFGGTGLGLSITYALCQRMGFELDVESELGSGSTFCVSFPDTMAPAPHERQPPPTSSGAQTLSAAEAGGGRRVLVVDDDPDARRLLTHLLQEMDCEVRTASGAREGLRMARAWSPELITVDLMMPETTGWEFLRMVQADLALADIPVAVVSMLADEHRSSLGGAVEIVNKPVEREDLERVLRALQNRPQRALVIEDNPDSRALLCELLENEGLVVAEAVNGAEGLRALENFTPEVILLDLMMPLMDGAEFLRKFRNDPRYRQIPVIVVTAKELMRAEQANLRKNASVIVQKGENLRSELFEALASVARPGAREHPSVLA